MNPIGSITNFPQGFANGINVRGIPLLQAQPGFVWFLGNGPALRRDQHAGSDSNRGTFNDPFGTLNYAVNTAAVGGRGDIICVLPGHAETISSATIALLQASGVAIVGLGAGSLRPTFTFTTATTATIPVVGANISIQNCLFVGNFLSIASVFTETDSSFTAVFSGTTMTASGVTGTIYNGATVVGTGVLGNTVVLNQLTGTTGGAGTYTVSQSQTVASVSVTTSPTDFSIDNCEFRDNSSVLGFLVIYTTSATANLSNRFSFTRNVVNSLGTVSPTTAIVTSVSQDGWNLSDNFMVAAKTNSDDPILLTTGAGNMTALTMMRNNTYRPNTSSSAPCAVSSSATAWSGVAALNSFGALPSGTGIWISTGTKLSLTQNFSRLTNTADKSNTLNPVAV